MTALLLAAPLVDPLPLALIECAWCLELVDVEVTYLCDDCGRPFCDIETFADDRRPDERFCERCINKIPSGSLCDPSDEDRDT